MNIIGVDLGTTLTKIVYCKDGEFIYKDLLEEKDFYNAINEFINKNNINILEVEKIVATGVGTATIDKKAYGIDTGIIEEFIAISNGAKFLTGMDNFLITSMGTGTSFIRVDKRGIEHFGGTGIGGGTLLNLANKLTGQNGFGAINILSKKGKLDKIDLKLKDVTNKEISNLDDNTTVSNLGKLDSASEEADKLLGIINMIFETVGVMSALAIRKEDTKTIVMVGTMTKLSKAEEILDNVAKLYNVNFIIPKDAEFASVIGAIKSAF